MPEPSLESVLRYELGQIRSEIALVQREVERHGTLLDGDEKRDALGLRQRVRELKERVDSMEKAIDAIHDEKKSTNDKLKGLAMGLFLIGVGNIPNFLQLLSLVAQTISGGKP
jgi:hypothetical protein